ncbi:MAG: magnesium transporter [Cyanobacteria bacterium SZAS TMP-1]|nr:magnesium transporter [Cyanobacteria bacterium SZAS TMP-1]
MTKLAEFKALDPAQQQGLFLNMSSAEQVELLMAMPTAERKIWLRVLDPDDAADVVQGVPLAERAGLLDLLDRSARNEVSALMAYAEDSAGGLMSPRYVRVRPDMTVDEATNYVRRQSTRSVETIHYAYVLDLEQKLLGVISCRQLLSAQPETLVSALMTTDLVVVDEQMHQEEVSKIFSRYSLLAIPVVGTGGRMKGIVTVDDIVTVVHEEATKDIQKMGGSEALDEPYLKIGLFKMFKKRGGWLMALFIGELFTASAMGYFEAEIAKAVVLALFVPLIISSGGNSGSQASTLVIRAMALGEVRLLDWWRVVRREVFTGLMLGALLGLTGLIRILLWQGMFHTYGEHAVLVALTVSLSLVVIVLWGGLAGSVLPFIMRRMGFDPATACTPFVATFVDVTGLIIYFQLARIVLAGTML